MNALLFAIILSAITPKTAYKQCDSVIYDAIDKEQTPGAVLCVVKNKRITYEKAYGVRSWLPQEEPMTTETIFDLASLSKCFGTTLAVMKLAEQGKISLNAKVSDYIPDFAPWVSKNKREKVDITIKHLMTHTSGLSAGVHLNTFLEKYGENQPDSLMHFIAQTQPRLFKPGTSWKYSCPNFIILADIVQIVSGQLLCDYVYENIYKPLGLKSTAYLPLDRPIPSSFEGRIAPTELLRDGTLLRGQVHDPPARIANWGNSGNAGLFSDVEDLAVLCSMIMNGGKYNNVQILKEDTVRLMCSVPYPKVGRAYGWDQSSSHAGIRGKFAKDRCICHTGYTGTSVVMDLDKKVAVILLCNRVHPVDEDSLGKTRTAIADIIWESL